MAPDVTMTTWYNDVQGVWRGKVHPPIEKSIKNKKKKGRKTERGKGEKNLLTFCRNKNPDHLLKEILDLHNQGSISGCTVVELVCTFNEKSTTSV